MLDKKQTYGAAGTARDEFCASSIMALPLDARQHEEFFLTAAQSLFALSLLIRLRFALWAALALMVLFVVQVTIAFVFRNDEARVIASLTTLA